MGALGGVPVARADVLHGDGEGLHAQVADGGRGLAAGAAQALEGQLAVLAQADEDQALEAGVGGVEDQRLVRLGLEIAGLKHAGDETARGLVDALGGAVEGRLALEEADDERLGAQFSEIACFDLYVHGVPLLDRRWPSMLFRWLVEEWVGAPFVADGRRRAMARVQGHMVRQREQVRLDGGLERGP
ncbi:hypothetical protein D3C72_1508770 [compost metagenome]